MLIFLHAQIRIQLFGVGVFPPGSITRLDQVTALPYIIASKKKTPQEAPKHAVSETKFDTASPDPPKRDKVTPRDRRAHINLVALPAPRRHNIFS